MKIRLLTILLFFGAAFGVHDSLAIAAETPAKKVSFTDDFSKGADRWQPSDPAAWKVIDTDAGKAYSLTKLSKYKPPHRSPLGFSLIKDLNVGDFTLEVQAQSTSREYPHQDLCLFFGYQDPAHFYYVHMGRKGDEHCNQIFIVNGADREKISTKTTDGTPWTKGWHQLKLVRNTADGAIEVYFDDLKTPAMTATDKHFSWGQVGVGSFDDTGNFRAVNLSGIPANRK